MNDELNHNPFESLRNTTLTKSEKESLHASVRGFVAENPVSPGRSWYSWFSRHVVAAAIASFVLIATGTGVFAHRSGPDDFLYSFRINVNDRVAVALAGDEDARIEKELENIGRMLDDEELFAFSEFSEVEFDDLEERIEHENEFEEELEQLEREMRDMEHEAEQEHQDSDDEHEDDLDDDLEEELEQLEREMRDMEHEAEQELE